MTGIIDELARVAIEELEQNNNNGGSCGERDESEGCDLVDDAGINNAEKNVDSQNLVEDNNSVAADSSHQSNDASADI